MVLPIVEEKVVNSLLAAARTYIGTPHTYGGQSKTGIDCSGLVYISFQEIGMQIPPILQKYGSCGPSR